MSIEIFSLLFTFYFDVLFYIGFLFSYGATAKAIDGIGNKKEGNQI